MKMNLDNVIAIGAVVASAVGFYLVGRYHEDYLNEKRNAAPAGDDDASQPEPATDADTE